VSDPYEAESNEAVRSVALCAHDAGLCAIRARVDGTKAPKPETHCGKVDPTTGERMAGWELFQSERPERLQVRGWFAEWPGMGIVCGAVSGNVEALELEGRAVAEGVLDQLDKALDAAGLSEVWSRIRAGYTESSPSGGLHWLCRISDGAALGSQKLAQRLATPSERAAHPKQLIVPLIETRGEGGFVVVAPSHGSTHPSGKPWELVCGGFDTIATITAGERNAIYDVCRSLDRLERTQEGIAKVPPARLAQYQRYDGGPVGASWMDAVERHLSATDSLSAAIERYGWVDLHRNDPQGCPLYERPGQDERGKVGGLVNASGRLVVFSTSTPFASTLEKDAHTGRGPTYSLLDVYAAYEHEGDRQAAAQAIAEETGILRSWRSEQDAETARMFGGSERSAGSGKGDEQTEQKARGWRDLILDGRTWLRSGSAIVETLWGDQVDALVPRLQPTLIVGETGAGKTTLAHHIILGAIGVPTFADVLGWPVRELSEGERVLYLASDRPDQARLALLRYFTPATEQGWRLLEERLRVWRGPPPATLAKSPGLLLEMAEATGAALVVVDSTKDMADKLSDDNVGSAINQAHQFVVASGRDMIALHHPRKRGRDHADTRPTLDDVYGSSWLSAGAGSVLFLIDEPLSTEVLQLKTPNGRESNFRFRMDPATGTLAVANDDILAAVGAGGTAGISTRQVAIAVLGVPDPSEAQVERIRRRLKVLQVSGVIDTTGAGRTTRWVVP
jgi:hypothetical protein